MRLKSVTFSDCMHHLFFLSVHVVASYASCNRRARDRGSAARAEVSYRNLPCKSTCCRRAAAYHTGAAVYGDFFAPKQHARRRGTLKGSSRSLAARSTTLRLTRRHARRRHTLDGGTLDGCMLDGALLGALRRCARRRHGRSTAALQRHIMTGNAFAWNRRTLAGGTLVGGTLVGGTLDGSMLDGALRRRARRWHAQWRHAQRCSVSPSHAPHRRHSTPPPSRRRRVTFAFPAQSGGRLSCTSRRIYLRVASPAVTSIGYQSVSSSVCVHCAHAPRQPHPPAHCR